MKYHQALLILLLPILGLGQKDKLKVMFIFAHPDEGEVYSGGTTALYANLGHEVKYLSLTNGDAGHHIMKPKELAIRRFGEAMLAKNILGLSEYEILNHHDGKLKNTLEIQQEVVKSIKSWKPDIVFTYYPAEGGHNDNMTAGYIVRDAVKLLDPKNLPAFIYVRDFHTSSFNYLPDIAIDIGTTWELKLKGLGAHQSQVVEFNAYQKGTYDEVQASKIMQEEYLYNNAYDWSHITPQNLVALKYWYGDEKALKVIYVESFEFAEFGTQIKTKDVFRLFPMLRN